jgi:hypothetical protein
VPLREFGAKPKFPNMQSITKHNGLYQAHSFIMHKKGHQELDGNDDVKRFAKKKNHHLFPK